MSTSKWVALDDNLLALSDPGEIAATFYIGIEQFYHVDPTRDFVSSEPISFEMSKLIDSAHPDIFKDPSTGSQLRPLEDLRLVRSEVAITNHWYRAAEAPTAQRAREVMDGGLDSIKTLPHAEPDSLLNELPVSVFAITIYLDALIASNPDLQSGFRPYNYVRRIEDVDDTLLEAALEDAFMFASDWADRSYRLMRNTVQVFTPKILDIQIPYTLGKPHSGLRLASGELNNPHRIRAVAAETAARLSNHVENFSDVEDLGPIEGFVSAMQEAESAFNRGLYSSAAIMSAAASEYSINTLLQLIQWEDGIEPDRSAASWDVQEGIQSRVKSKFAPHLGGNWDLTKHGTLRNWAESVAELRNYIAHAGHVPTADEAERSIRCAYELQVELADRVITERNIGKYTRTAYILAGNEGIERRNRRTRRVRELQDSTTEPVWRRSSMAWIEQHGQCLRAARFGWGEATPSERDVLLIVRSSDQRISIIEFAKSLGWAREINNPQVILSHFPEASLLGLLDRIPNDYSDEYVSIQLKHPQVIPDRHAGPKMPAFRLVPIERISPKWTVRAEAEFREMLSDYFHAAQ